ncbi:NAD(P)-binding Rossmann-fold superfamily protein [Rhynchospora pubera]|uniref:NAD(P)-binding Rossmann-fold superfamily protein n=1 Tax=Rhynchospora pubera TaxID=906938 RepID=A0AAV8FYR3_9POAL|nr:NAD(P)-binding Rossmann-fold superfamily protein [Rhynchospora pubera]
MEKSYDKRVLLTASDDEVSKGIAFHLAKFGCRLVLVGDERSLRGLAAQLFSSLDGTTKQIQVVNLNFQEENESKFDSAVEQAWSIFGGLDAFVNCYAYEGPMLDCLDISEGEYKKTIRINVMAPWFLLKAVAKRMRDNSDSNPNSMSGWGSIVFLTQILGAERGLYPGSAAFGSSLASVQQLARLSAMELGKHKIRVNAISRGLHLGDNYPSTIGKARAEKLTGDAMPLQRWLDPKNDLASTVLYLIGDESRYMTGTTIFVDGAQSIVRPRMRSFM